MTPDSPRVMNTSSARASCVSRRRRSGSGAGEGALAQLSAPRSWPVAGSSSWADRTDFDVPAWPGRVHIPSKEGSMSKYNGGETRNTGPTELDRLRQRNLGPRAASRTTVREVDARHQRLHPWAALDGVPKCRLSLIAAPLVRSGEGKVLCPGNEQESAPAIVERATFRFDEPGTARSTGCSIRRSTRFQFVHEEDKACRHCGSQIRQLSRRSVRARADERQAPGRSAQADAVDHASSHPAKQAKTAAL